MNDTTWHDELMRYRAARDARLRGDYGWLSLVARDVLDDGDNVVDGGVASLRDGAVTLMLADGTRHTWPAEAAGPGPYVFAGATRWELLRQGGRVAVRARNPASPTRAAFSGVPTYAPDPRYCVRAQLDVTGKKTIRLATGIGGDVDNECPGTLRFTLLGNAYALDPVIESDAPGQLFLLFKDLTNTDTTYGAGRFLYTALPDADGVVVVDFNKAFNPPCALTPFASCPIAPAQNRLPLRIEAGEKTPHDPH